MAIIKCKMCGGDLNFAEDASIAECEYCGSVQTVPKADDEKKLIQFERAERLRKQCEFDKAAGIYESIVAEFRQEAEAYWGLVLCKFGIEYVDDPATGKKIPTCHRSGFESVLKDSDFEQAQENADVAARKVYRDEAKQIEELRKGIIAVSANEQPYDVFICYKETDEKGNRTLDSVLAQDIYDALTSKGYRVFFSRISLEDKLGLEYEPYIFAALNSAKIMLAIGTDYEYYNAVWVRNEWSRFLKLMAKDKDKHLIPCFKGIDAYDMPEEFAKLQAQDLNKMGAVQDILYGVEKLLSKQEIVKETTVVATGSANIESLLERVFMFCEDGAFDSADEYCEKVLDIDPKNAQAYLGKLMAELRVRKQEDLENCAQPFDGSNNYQKVIRFADEKLKAALTGYIAHITTRNENARVEDVYTRAKRSLNEAKFNVLGRESSYKKAAELFGLIRDYKDSEELKKFCFSEAEKARKDAILAAAKGKMAGAVVSDYETAISMLKSVSGWKDAEALLKECEQKYAKAKQTEKRIKKIAVIVIAAVVAILLIVTLLNEVIIPAAKYSKAVKMMEAGNYQEAYTIFKELGDFKDSAKKAVSASLGGVVEIDVGDTVIFGTYEQDNDLSNGKEEIEWVVLDVQDKKALVISKYVLDCKQYNTTYTDVTWKTSSIRKWLNDDFINGAFSKGEQAIIPTVTVLTQKTETNNTNAENGTRDKVFLLSRAEAENYFSSDSARQCQPTNYAIVNSSKTDLDNVYWWLRTPGQDFRCKMAVSDTGVIMECGYVVDRKSNGVRPALWIDLGEIS